MAFCSCLVIGCAKSGNDSARYEITSKDEGDVMLVAPNHIEIRSKKGIGRTVIKLLEGEWPAVLKIRLYLSGLEGLTLKSGDAILEKHDLAVQAYDQAGLPFEEKYLLDEAGYYEVSIAPSLIGKDSSELLIHWVDFYR